MWFPRLACDRVLKARPVEAPFALTLSDKNSERSGLTLRLGLGDTRGAAWALARHGQTTGGLDALPVAALRLEAEVVTGLQRLGLRSIGDLKATARAPLARRFVQGEFI